MCIHLSLTTRCSSCAIRTHHAPCIILHVQRGHCENLTEEEAKELVLQAIAAGIDNDLGSGSNIDVCVITAERGLEHHRGAWKDPGLGAAVGENAAAGPLLSQDQPSHIHSTEEDLTQEYTVHEGPADAECAEMHNLVLVRQ